MFERTLKDLANRHFEVIWRYENMTNSIMVRLEKRFDHQWYKLERRIGFDIQHAPFRILYGSNFERYGSRN